MFSFFLLRELVLRNFHLIAMGEIIALINFHNTSSDGIISTQKTSLELPNGKAHDSKPRTTLKTFGRKQLKLLFFVWARWRQTFVLGWADKQMMLNSWRCLLRDGDKRHLSNRTMLI